MIIKDSKYPTSAGYVTREEAYLKFMHHISEAADMAATVAHLYRADETPVGNTLAHGWLGIHQLLLRLITQVRNIVANKLN